MSSHRIAELFIRCSQYREACWRAHIAKRERQALEQATLLVVASRELQGLLAEGEPAPLRDPFLDAEGRN